MVCAHLLTCDLHDYEVIKSLNNPGGGGGGYLKKFYTGRLRPEVQPLTLLYTIFFKKGTPSVYLLLEKGTPFIYLTTVV